MNRPRTALPLVVVLATLIACGGSSSGSSGSGGSSGADGDGSSGSGGGGSTATGIAAAAPIFAIASPVAQRSGASNQQAPGGRQALVARQARSNAASAPGPQASSLPHMLSALQARLDETTLAGCLPR